MNEICFNCRHEIELVDQPFTEKTIPMKCPNCGRCIGCD
jgi:hypothetical protein